MSSKLERQKRQLARAADRARLKAIREKLRELRRARPERMRQIREACRIGRENVRANVKALRAETLARLRETAQRMRDAQRGTCSRTKAETKDTFHRTIGEASRELAGQRDYLKREYGRRPSSRTTAKERREESDDAVRSNLPPELVPVFNRKRGEVRPRRGLSRTEAFLQWVHDNPDEAHRIVYDAVERDVERLIREQEAVERRIAGGHRGAAALEALEADVPF